MTWVLGQLDLATLSYDRFDAVDGVCGCAGGLGSIPARQTLWAQMWLAGFLEP